MKPLCPLELTYDPESEPEHIGGPVFRVFLVDSVRPDGLKLEGALPVELAKHLLPPRRGPSRSPHARAGRGSGRGCRPRYRPYARRPSSVVTLNPFLSVFTAGCPERRHSAWALGPPHGALIHGAHRGFAPTCRSAASGESGTRPRNRAESHTARAARRSLCAPGRRWRSTPRAGRILPRPARSAVLGWGQRRRDPIPVETADVGRLRGL